VGCDRLPFLGGRDADTTATRLVQAPPDTAPAAVDTTVREPIVMPPTPRQPAPPLMDEPWTPADTGTVAPGMTRMDVIALWGVPVAERTSGTRGYLYFRNGCEVSCGTFDVVFLENDQVVDAIVRSPGHGYSGVSSSPAGRTAEATPPGQAPGSGTGAE
jgi:hypothetical protein